MKWVLLALAALGIGLIIMAMRESGKGDYAAAGNWIPAIYGLVVLAADAALLAGWLLWRWLA